MKNVNTFSYSRYLKRNDPRRTKYRSQRKERGFDNSELWDLSKTILRFTLPRLIVFRDYTTAVPNSLSSMEEWKSIMDEMIEGFPYYIDDDYEHPKAVRALELFFKYFTHLWD